MILKVMAAVALTAAVAIGGGQSPDAADSANDSVVALVRGDALVLPLARFDGRMWQPLVEPDSDPQRLMTDGRRLTGSRLTLFPIAPGESRVLRLGDVVEAQAHCSTMSMLRSDAAPRSPASRDPRKPLGLASSTNIVVSRTDDMRAQPDDESRRVARLIVGQVQAFEADAAAAGATELAGIDRPLRSRTPVVLRRLDRYGTRYYFEAAKRYARGDRVLDVFGSGWLQAGDGRIGSTAISFALTDEDYKAVARREPAGVVHATDRQPRRWPVAAWVMLEYHYEGESYAFYNEVDALGHAALRIFGGGC
jgi:hypothetical protein